jgi:hypothetical protein
VGPVAPGPVAKVLADDPSRSAVERLLRAARERAGEVLVANRRLVDALVDALLEREELVSDEITAVLIGTPADVPMSATGIDLTDSGSPPRPGGLIAELADLVTVILGHARLLDAALAESADGRDAVAAINIAAERAAAVTTRLVSSVRAGAGKPSD